MTHLLISLYSEQLNSIGSRVLCQIWSYLNYHFTRSHTVNHFGLMVDFIYSFLTLLVFSHSILKITHWKGNLKGVCYLKGMRSIHLRPIMSSCINVCTSFYLGFVMHGFSFWISASCVWIGALPKGSHPPPPTGTSSLSLHLSHSPFPLPRHNSVTVHHLQSGPCFPSVLFSCCPFKLSPSHLSPSSLCSSLNLS